MTNTSTKRVRYFTKLPDRIIDYQMVWAVCGTEAWYWDKDHWRVSMMSDTPGGVLEWYEEDEYAIPVHYYQIKALGVLPLKPV